MSNFLITVDTITHSFNCSVNGIVFFSNLLVKFASMLPSLSLGIPRTYHAGPGFGP